MKKNKKNFDSMGSHQKKVYIKRKKMKIKKIRNAAIVSAIIICILFIFGSIFYAKYTQVKQAHAAFAKYGDVEISKIDYIFYYNNFLSSWVSNNIDKMDVYGLDLNKSFDSQIYDKDTNETWGDYFDETVQNFISTLYAEHEQAVKEGFKDNKDSFSDFINKTKKDAEEKNMSYKEYLHENYSKDMSIKDFEKVVEFYTLATAYDNSKFEEYSKEVTDEEIENYYQSNKNMYDFITYKSFIINTSNSNEATDHEKESLKKEADEIAKQIKDEKTFNKTASLYVEGELKEHKASSQTGVDEDISEWLYSSDRKPGDFSGPISNEAGTIYTFVYFISRDLDKDKTVNYRIVYKKYKPEEETAKDDENVVFNKDEDTEALPSYETAKAQIQKYADGYTDSPIESTIEKYAAEENIDNNGAYYNVSRSQINNKEIADWLWDDSRQEKDIKIIEDKQNAYIYLFYWKSSGDPYYKIAIRNGLSNDNYNKWVEELNRKTLLMLNK